MSLIVHTVVLISLLRLISCFISQNDHNNPLNMNIHNISTGIPYDMENQNKRTPKFLFTLIRFGNEPCPTTNEEHGICYTRNQCAILRGIAAGSCAQGLGVCCQFQATCGSVVTQNGTLFRNPDFPNKYRPSSGSDVCQIDGPVGPATTPGGGVGTTNEVGSCKTDALTITSSGATVPTICGSNSGQHVYLDFGSSDTVTLNILLSSNANRDREWSIEILQLGCRSETRAPSGCLQYFEGVFGQVRSFNLGGGIHLANMDYSVCVRMEDGMRSIEWSACSVGEVKISGPTPLPTQTNAVVNCPAANLNDYLVIAGGVAYPIPSTLTLITSTTDRFCDQHFGYSNSLVRSTSRPFILRFRTDRSEVSTPAMEASGGYCLKWEQSPQVF